MEPDKSGQYFLGTDQRYLFAPILKDILNKLPKNSTIFDIGAGGGEIIDLALRDGVKGKAKVSILEPNPIAIETYKSKIKTASNLELASVYPVPLQKLLNEKKDDFELKNQNLVLSIHMIYFLTDFTALNLNYEKILVDTLCWKYATLAPTGKIFLCYAAGGPNTAIAFGETWFKTINPNWSTNLSKIVELRKKLFEEGEILKFLKQKFPTTNSSIQIVKQPTSFFGKHRGDVATFCCLPMIPSNEEIFDVNLLKAAIAFIRASPLKKEANDNIWKNRWKFSSPQMIVIITREK